MPWEAKRHNNQWCVFEKGESAPIKGGCHGDDKAAAEKHVAALYASEDGMKSHEKMAMDYYPLYGVTSFAELDDLQQAEHVAHEMGELLEHFQMIAGNIVGDIEIADKAAALRALTDEFIGRVETAGDMEEKQRGVIGSVLKEIPEPDPELHTKEQPGFMVWKDKDTGRYRWLAIYSNKYRDDDRPAEIISEKSHRMFVKMVREGAVDYPELWQWHIPGTRWGEADYVDYTDNGFSMASGLVDEGSEAVAESYAKEKPGAIRVSHGMPKMLLVRDEDDPSVINFHVTTEISPLPATKAANPYTGFHVLSTGDGAMSLSDEQRKYLEAHGLKSDQVELIAEGLTQLGKQAQADGRESKQAKKDDEPEATTEPQEPAAEAQVEDEPVAEDTPQFVTRTEFDALRTEIAGAMAEFVTGAQTIGESVKSLQATVHALQADDGEKIAKAAADTPPASLSALIAQSVIGNDKTRIDGRSKEAKAGPKETEAKKNGGLFFEEWMGGQAH